MRENRSSGSEGGVALIPPSLPLSYASRLTRRPPARQRVECGRLRLFSRLTERLACAPALAVRRLAAAFVRGRKTGQWPVRRAPGRAPLRRHRSAAGREGVGLDGVSPHRR